MNIQKGQRVYSGLYGGRHGVVYEVLPYEKKRCAPVQTLCNGVVATGGSANYKIVFKNGSLSNVPECIVRGVQWKIYDEIAPDFEIVELLENSMKVRAEKERQEKLKQEAHEKKIQEYRNSYPDLKQVVNSYDKQKIGSANLKKELRKAFPGVKFSVRSDHSSINVHWPKGTEIDRKEIEKIADKYQYGGFDGMTDCPYLIDNPWSDVFGGARYVFCQEDWA